jgi:hypothetical protein
MGHHQTRSTLRLDDDGLAHLNLRQPLPQSNGKAARPNEPLLFELWRKRSWTCCR